VHGQNKCVKWDALAAFARITRTLFRYFFRARRSRRRRLFSRPNGEINRYVFSALLGDSPFTRRAWKRTFHSSLVSSAFIYFARRTEKLANPSCLRFYQQARLSRLLIIVLLHLPRLCPEIETRAIRNSISLSRIPVNARARVRARHRVCKRGSGGGRSPRYPVIVNHTRIYSKR